MQVRQEFQRNWSRRHLQQEARNVLEARRHKDPHLLWQRDIFPLSFCFVPFLLDVLLLGILLVLPLHVLGIVLHLLVTLLVFVLLGEV